MRLRKWLHCLQRGTNLYALSSHAYSILLVQNPICDLNAFTPCTRTYLRRLQRLHMQLQHFWLNDAYWGQDGSNPAGDEKAIATEKTHALNIVDTLLSLKDHHLQSVRDRQAAREARQAAQLADTSSKHEARAASSAESQGKLYLDNLFDIFSNSNVQ